MQIDSELISSITEFLPMFIPGVFVIGWCFFVFTRHSNLRNMFFWEKIMGRKLEFSDELFSKAVQEQTELEQLRVFLPKFQFKSVYHAKAIIEWCNVNKIGHNQIKNLDNFFEYKNNIACLKKENTILKGVSFIAFLSFFLISIFSITFSLKAKVDNAILATVKDTYKFVFVYKDKIESASFFGESWVLHKGDNNKTVIGGISPDNVAKLKDDLDKERTVKFVNDNIKLNFYSFLFIAIAFFAYTMPPLFYLNKASRVSGLAKQIHEAEVDSE